MSGVEFNLLPDIKQRYIKVEKTRRLITLVSIIVTAVALGILIILVLYVDGFQKKQLSDLNKDIKRDSTTIQQTPDINKILTVQNQLNSLTGLHNQKPAASRLFGYLKQVTPSKADINNMAIDFTQKTATITGSADTLTTVNKFVDTLKFTMYTAGKDSSQTHAFSNIVLTSFGTTQGRATYTITLAYDPTIFDITQDVTLVVPQITTTRSELSNPDVLFKAGPATDSSGKTATGGGQ